MSETPGLGRIKLGLQATDELGPYWVALDGEDILGRIELAASLTLEFAEDWAAVFCFCARSGRPVSAREVTTALRLDDGVATRCLVRLKEEKLLEEATQAGAYRFAPGRRAGVDQIQAERG